MQNLLDELINEGGGHSDNNKITQASSSFTDKIISDARKRGAELKKQEVSGGRKIENSKKQNLIKEKSPKKSSDKKTIQRRAKHLFNGLVPAEDLADDGGVGEKNISKEVLEDIKRGVSAASSGLRLD